MADRWREEMDGGLFDLRENGKLEIASLPMAGDPARVEIRLKAVLSPAFVELFLNLAQREDDAALVRNAFQMSAARLAIFALAEAIAIAGLVRSDDVAGQMTTYLNEAVNTLMNGISAATNEPAAGGDELKRFKRLLEGLNLGGEAE